MHPDLIGFFAAFLTTVCFIPQAWRVIRTRDTHALSIWMYGPFTLGVFFWLIYGISLSNVPIIIANTITFALSSVILYMKATENRRK